MTGNARMRKKFTWLPIIGPGMFYWLQWVRVVEDQRVDESGRTVWRLVSVNGRLV